MKQVLVLGGSSSKFSINKAFAEFAQSQLKETSPNTLDLNNFEMPIYSIDKEKGTGVPSEAKKFIKHIDACDGILISLAEHNGSYSTAMKNIIDWCSREMKDFWQEKPMLLLSTSPGGRGAQSVLEQAKAYFPRLGANIVASFSLPQFNQNMVDGEMVNEEVRKSFQDVLDKFEKAL